MANRKPIVITSGVIGQLPTADTLEVPGTSISINGVSYAFPAAGAAGVLTNNGSNVLSWGAAGGGGRGTAVVDFGVFPGTTDATVAVTGQTGIVAGSIVQVQISCVASADHTADDHFVETLQVQAGNIVAGTGFTIYARGTNSLAEPVITRPSPGQMVMVSATTVNWINSAPRSADPDTGGTVPRIWGRWNVAWKWA